MKLAVPVYLTNTNTGCPTGTPEFVATLEQQIGRCLTHQQQDKIKENN